jgi:hypothetical protein
MARQTEKETPWLSVYPCVMARRRCLCWSIIAPKAVHKGKEGLTNTTGCGITGRCRLRLRIGLGVGV